MNLRIMFLINMYT